MGWSYEIPYNIIKEILHNTIIANILHNINIVIGTNVFP